MYRSGDMSRRNKGRMYQCSPVLVHGAYFGVATGQLSVRDLATEKFVQVAADEHARMFAQPRF